MQIYATIVKNNVEVSQETENRIIDWAFPLLSTFPKHMKALTQKYMHTSIHWSIIFNSQDTEQSKFIGSEWIKPIWYIYIQWDIIQQWKEWNIAIWKNVDGSSWHNAMWNK